MLTIRKAQPSDLNEMQQLFVDTITAICSKDYNEEQIKIWGSSTSNTQRWTEILTEQHSLVAVMNDKILGYATLANNSYIDLLYVHKDFQGQGIATRLFNELALEARKKGVTVLASHASKTAKHFFEKQGFEVLSENTRSINGVEIMNYYMEKRFTYL